MQNPTSVQLRAALQGTFDAEMKAGLSQVQSALQKAIFEYAQETQTKWRQDNLVTSLMLEFFESQIEQRRPTTLGLFQTKLRELIKLDGRPAKPYGSSTRITSAQAREHAAREIKAFKEQTRLKAEERGDRELGSIVKAIKAEKKSR